MPDLRIGYGWDSHEFAPNTPLWLGGVQLDSPLGLAGHSDGDVLLHALCDALLGGLALGDIGAFFPPGDPQWRGAASSLFVRHALDLVHQQGWDVVNIDATLILEKPRLQPLRDRLRQNVAEILKVGIERVSIKGKTPEGMGTGNAAIAHVTALLAKRA